MLSTTLIEKSLALTGKTMEDMNIPKYLGDSVVNGMAFPEFGDMFSIEKFFYYLLSPGFIEDFYYKIDAPSDGLSRVELVGLLGAEIWDYQSGNESPLVELLSKI